MTSTRDKSCEERIAGELQSRLQSIGDLFDKTDSDDDEVREEAIEELDTYPLSVGIEYVVTVLISTGGPADWFEATVGGGEITRIEYVYQDWFDSARRVLDFGTDEYGVAERFISYYAEILDESYDGA
jgi:hypothetical protein